MSKYPFYKQLNSKDCGPSCLRMICKSYGRGFSLEHIRRKCYVGREGVSLWNINQAAVDMGFRTMYAKLEPEDMENSNFPCILHWRGKHFVVLYKYKKHTVIIGDPAIGIMEYSRKEFVKYWTNDDEEGKGIVLLMEPSPNFYQEKEDETKKIGFGFFLHYLRPFKKYYVQLGLGMLVSMIFSLILPFLTQSIIDVGIMNKNLGFIQVVILAQIFLGVGRTAMSFIQSWISLHVGARINIALISDYLIKLLKLPISFFDSRMMGDIMQRIGDHTRIQSFVSSTTLGTAFSLLNVIVFSVVMGYYSSEILIYFLLFNLGYAAWIMFFLKKRKELDYRLFERNALKQNTLIQLLYGIRDIKLHNYEDKKRWEWERTQVKGFQIGLEQLVISQVQQGGAFLIETAKAILITYLSAKLVIEGKMTLGMMLSMQYILGQIASPLSQLIGLINSYQDAKISLERITDIHNAEEEINPDSINQIDLPQDTTIRFENVSFSYDGDPDGSVLKNVSFHIPEGKVTAIVGESGGGKTTIIKLLLKFYKVASGRINIGNINLTDMNTKMWRKHCGAVLQDGYIFSDSIAANIALNDENISLEKLSYIASLANIESFINELPRGYNTVIGSDGVGLSQGQKQRLLLARAIYNDPKFLFLDEATNSLDAKNEYEILNKLQECFKGKTVLIVAHRLSTIRNADQIIVFENGSIAEIGTHESLMENRAVYFDLVNKQTSNQVIGYAE